MKFFPYFYIPKMLWQMFEVFCWNISLSINLSFLKSGECQLFCGYECWRHIFQLRPNIFVSDHNDFCHAFAVLYYYFLLCVQIYCYFIASTNAKKVPKQIVYTVKAKININDLFILNTCHFLESLKCLFTPFHHM